MITVTYPDGMVIDDNRVLAIVEIHEVLTLRDNIPKRIAICECLECGIAGTIIYGERTPDEWLCNWDVSRILAHVFLEMFPNPKK